MCPRRGLWLQWRGNCAPPDAHDTFGRGVIWQAPALAAVAWPGVHDAGCGCSGVATVPRPAPMTRWAEVSVGRFLFWLQELRSQPRVRAWPGRPVRQILARKTGKANLARKARMTGKANSRAWRPLHVRIRVAPAVRTGWWLFLIQKGLRNRPFLRAGYPPPRRVGDQMSAPSCFSPTLRPEAVDLWRPRTSWSRSPL